MNSQTIVEKYGAKLEGQQLLWQDYDLILRKTPFQDIDPEFNKQALIHWWMEVYVSDGCGEQETSQKVYSSWSNGLYKNFEYAKASGLYHSQNNQSAIQLGAIKNEPIEDQIEELKMWLSYTKPIKNEYGVEYKFVSIFESTLSRHGIYHLQIHSDDNIKLMFTRYGNPSVLKEFKSLEDAVEYVAKNHYYKKSKKQAYSDEEVED